MYLSDSNHAGSPMCGGRIGERLAWPPAKRKYAESMRFTKMAQKLNFPGVGRSIQLVGGPFELSLPGQPRLMEATSNFVLGAGTFGWAWMMAIGAATPITAKTTFILRESILLTPQSVHRIDLRRAF